MNIKDYDLDTENSNLAEIVLTSRYPENLYAMNTECEMTVYIAGGKVSLTKDGIVTPLEKGKAVLIKKSEKYFWQPEPEATLVIFSTPPWSSDQQVTA